MAACYSGGVWGEANDMRLGCRARGLLALALAAGCSVYDASLISEGNAGVPSRPPLATSSPDDAEALVFGLKDVFIRQSAEMAASSANRS